mmetsp:Transcript_5572/g.4240  ORF Transcript_5572/g.4240 Transcript_5572/m.4240 type:complete len:133 (-) Transcript_5572:326-724(-)
MSLVFLIQKMASEAGISGAVIMTLMAGRSLISAFCFYLAYDEMLMAKHLVGMVLLICCITCIALGTEGKGERAEDVGWTMFLIICGCLFNCFIYTGSSFLARITSHRNFSQPRYSADGMVVFSIVYLGLMLY